MSFQDNTLAFQTGGWTTAQTVSATADGSQVVDVTGAGSGNAPAMINGFPASNTAIGEDYGAGDGVAIPYLYLTIPTVSGGTQTGSVIITLSAAPDNGSYGQGSYTTIYTSKSFTSSTFTNGSTLLVPVPPTLFAMPNSSSHEALPRFYKITYTVTGTMSQGFLAGLMLNPPSSLLGIQYNENFIAV